MVFKQKIHINYGIDTTFVVHFNYINMMIKPKDFIFVLTLFLIFIPFIVSDELFSVFEWFTVEHPYLSAFIKFSILATLGESLGLRITKGSYNQTGFGLLPRAVVWGLLGILIQVAFIVFAKGTPYFLASVFKGTSWQKQTPLFVTALTTSVLLNVVFAPVMMTIHKITDTHIVWYHGKISALFRAIDGSKILKNLDWNTQWNFVFKKTIPLFWIPAHTITFMLPSQFRILFAAVLGIVLGVILSVANRKN